MKAHFTVLEKTGAVTLVIEADDQPAVELMKALLSQTYRTGHPLKVWRLGEAKIQLMPAGHDHQGRDDG